MKQSSTFPVVFLVLALTACGEPTEPQLEVWTDPVSGEESLFRVRSIEPWTLYALDEAPEGLAVVARSGQPIVSFDEMRYFGAISILNGKAQGLGQIYAYDTNGDGVIDRVELISSDTSLEINLVEGAWVISSTQDHPGSSGE